MSRRRPRVVFRPSARQVDVFRPIEVEIEAVDPGVVNPFTDVRIEGRMRDPGGAASQVEGFCDSQDGSLFRIRFMPRCPGSHTLDVVYRRQDGFSATYSGAFEAVAAGHRGVLRADPAYPWHFVWEGTGEHCFLNGTTCYYLMGFEDEGLIRGAIDRLRGYRVNRIRVLLYGRQHDHPWGTPVVNEPGFRMALCPWVARYPEDITNPGFDLSRFNVAHWQKYERLLSYARDRDILVSVIFFIGAQPLAVPFAENSEDEYRYYRYAAARLSSFSNVTWDLGNEHDFHRNTGLWTPVLGTFLMSKDPVKHLCGAHNKAYPQPWYTWLGMQLTQLWDSGLNKYVLALRKAQADTGRIVPQIVEEYGYESHLEKHPGHRSADTRRRCAWEVSMAGGYQTNGEREQTGGGWVNGRGDDSMTMFRSFAPLLDFFQSFEWWKAEPHNELVARYDPAPGATIDYYDSTGARVTDLETFCLAEPGKAYVLYLPAGGSVDARIDPGAYSVSRLNPRDGARCDLADAAGPLWSSPPVPDHEDWVFHLTRKDA